MSETIMRERRLTMTMRWRAVILLVATLSVLAGSVKAEEKASGAYDLLDQSALNKALEGMQMRELLTQLSEDVGGGDDSLAQMRIKARLKLVDYRTKRNVPGAKYLDEAADIYTQIIVKFSSDNPTTSPDKWDEALAMQWLAHCRDRLSLAYVAGYLQSNPLALRVQYLHASEEDRRLLGVYAKRAVSEIDKLELILSDLEDEWGQSEYFGLYIVTGESLENIG
ncbi:MAG TPA: hypothetical protein ENL03_05025, partial [Phycisphaerae bacterium]|nr:hypothetical protein [Phycisphaerae bacterium]